MKGTFVKHQNQIGGQNEGQMKKIKIEIKDKSCGGHLGLVTPQQPMKNWQFHKLQILFNGACSWLDVISFGFHLG